MLSTRSRPNFAIVLLCLVVCSSTYYMTLRDLYFTTPIEYQYNGIPAYTLNTVNSTYYVYPMEHLPTSDYKRLVNLRNFKFDLLDECTSSPFLLVLIVTAPNNFERRKSIRETWGREKKNFKLGFLLGSVPDPLLQEALETENKLHKDFIQGRFLDTYRNLTYKYVMAFKYAIYHCPQAKYILKTDDDVFVNMPLMMDFLIVELSRYGAKNLLLCTFAHNLIVERNMDLKWSASYTEYKDKYYPPYCCGWAVLFSPDVLFTLYRAAQKADFFWIDDILITGILPQNENIEHSKITALILPPRLLEIIRQGGPYKSKIFLYGPPDLSVTDVYMLWDFVKNQTNSAAVLKRPYVT